MTEKLHPCMGGWCTVREKCAHYWAPKIRNVPPSERLCIPRQDGEAMTLRPVDVQAEPQEAAA